MSEWNVNLNDYFESEEQIQSSEVVEPGMYHLKITGTKDYADAEHPRLGVTLQVLAGSVDGQAGKAVWITIWPPTPGTEPRFLKLRYRTLAQIAYVLGFRRKGELGTLNFDPERLVGQHFFGSVVQRSYTDAAGNKQSSAEINWRDSLPINAPGTEVLARDEEALLVAGYAPQSTGDIQDDGAI